VVAGSEGAGSEEGERKKERERERRGLAGREGCAGPRRVFLLMAISAFSWQTKARAWLMSLPAKLFKQTLRSKTRAGDHKARDKGLISPTSPSSSSSPAP